ncbi:MAG TPA: transposase family protein [Ignavibacteria bacterium]
MFLLIYLKTNPLQEHHAASFGITQPQANILIHLL